MRKPNILAAPEKADAAKCQLSSFFFFLPFLMAWIKSGA